MSKLTKLIHNPSGYVRDSRLWTRLRLLRPQPFTDTQLVVRDPLLREPVTSVTFRQLLLKGGVLLKMDTVDGEEAGNAVWSEQAQDLLVQAAVLAESLYASLHVRAKSETRRVTRSTIAACANLLRTADNLRLDVMRSRRCIASMHVEIWDRDLAEGAASSRGNNVLAKRVPSPLLEKCFRTNARHLALKRLHAAPADEERTFDVDVVYTWVDHRDPKWRELIGKYRNLEEIEWDRYTSIDELRYSLRTIAAFAPWVRKIFIVTNCTPPAWFRPHLGVEFVAHEQIFPSDLDCLPTFSSHAIESCLAHVPGLAEHFVYFNDDVFLGMPASKRLFFAANGCSVSYLEPYGMVIGEVNAENPDYLNAAINGRELIRARFGYVPTQLHRHAPHALRRTVLLDMERDFPQDFERVRTSRFRQVTDISVTSFLYHHYAFQKREAIRGSASACLVNQKRYERELSRILDGRKYRFFCVNDGGDSSGSPSYVAAKAAFLQTFMPYPAPWENDD